MSVNCISYVLLSETMQITFMFIFMQITRAELCNGFKDLSNSLLRLGSLYLFGK